MEYILPVNSMLELRSRPDMKFTSRIWRNRVQANKYSCTVNMQIPRCLSNQVHNLIDCWFNSFKICCVEIFTCIFYELCIIQGMFMAYWSIRNEDFTLQYNYLTCTGIHWSAWSLWSAWSRCTGQCNQGYGSREQSRTRTRVCLHADTHDNQQFCNGTSAEVDRRPCNMVELYGMQSLYQNEQNL